MSRSPLRRTRPEPRVNDPTNVSRLYHEGELLGNPWMADPDWDPSSYPAVGFHANVVVIRDLNASYYNDPANVRAFKPWTVR